MKHPALTRFFSVLLVILCLTMATAGGLGLLRAEKDRQSVLDDMGRLRLRIEEYQRVTELLDGTQSYQKQNEDLTRKQSQHSKESSEHRAELATFTATQYGINMGTEAMDQADLQFEAYRAHFESGLSAFQSGMDQASGLLNQLWTLYNAAAPVLQNAGAHLGAARSVTAALDSGELTYSQVVAGYDEMIRMADESTALVDTLRELEPTLDALAAFDPNSLAGLADGMGQIPDSLGAFGGVDLSVYQENGVDVNFDLNQLVQMKDSFNQYWAVIKQGLALLNAADQASAEIQQATGLSPAELRSAAQAARDELAARGDEPLEPEAKDAILAAYNANRDAIVQGLDQAGAILDQVNGSAGQIQSFLRTTQSQLDGLQGLIQMARKAITDGAQALYDARALIWWQMGQQREKEEELRQEKERLDEDAEVLEQLNSAAEDQKTLEQEQSSLRASLLSRDEVRARYDAGEELGAAAANFADESERTAGETYDARHMACLVMLIGAGFGLLGVPAAFESIRSRFLLVVPVLFCLGCAAAADVLFVHMGRGHSYSALAVAIFALLQLLVSLPKKKQKRSKRSGGRHLKENMS